MLLPASRFNTVVGWIVRPIKAAAVNAYIRKVTKMINEPVVSDG
jgi:hypothetical protein